MDQFGRYYFGMIFRDRFRDARSDDFQRFFGRIMNLRYPGDFCQTRPWGSLGDNKCDGYLPSQRKFYQCYGPDELAQSKTITKLNEDFDAAFPFREPYFDTWVFVHNGRDGRLPSWLVLELNNLRTAHDDVRIETIGYSELFQEALSLSDFQLVDLFGPFPSLADVLAVQFDDIVPLLNQVSAHAIPDDIVPKPVSPKKLQHNQLSQDVDFCLRHGMLKAHMVGDYLDRTPDKELAARVTAAFRDRYLQLKQGETDPDTVFYGLRVFAQGQFAQTPRTEGAVLAVLAYLFEECDIFENPDEERSP